MSAARYWCELAWLGGPDATSGVVIDVDGDRVTAVTTDVAVPPPGAVRLAGLTMPAFANAHSHAFHRALRGRTHGGEGDFWSWRELMYSVAGRLDPDSYHELARAVFAEMVEAGYGVVGEFHYVHHRQDGVRHGDPNAIGAAIVGAARDAGIRLTLLDTLYQHGGVDRRGVHRDAETNQRRFVDRTVRAWAERAADAHDRFTGPDVVVGAAIHSVRAVAPLAMQEAAAWCKERSVPLHAHVSETRAEHDECRERLGSTPIGLLDANGALGHHTTLVHATWADEDDTGRIADAGAAVCFCPTTERDLGDGVGPSWPLADRGVPLCLGSDSHAVIDPLVEARTLELDARPAARRRGLHAPDRLARMATSNGYGSLGWPDGGAIAPGHLADLAAIGLDSARLAGTEPADALDAALFAGTSDDVTDVVVAGRHVVRGGRHVAIDVPDALHRAIERVFAS